jgi:hypothetical protein
MLFMKLYSSFEALTDSHIPFNKYINGNNGKNQQRNHNDTAFEGKTEIRLRVCPQWVLRPAASEAPWLPNCTWSKNVLNMKFWIIVRI